MKYIKLLLIIFFILLFACNNYAQGDAMKDFDNFRNKWNNKAGNLLDEALQYIAKLENLPTSDGSFSDIRRAMVNMPFKKSQVPHIIKIINKEDPHLQEAGVYFASASVEGLNNHDEFEVALCKLMKKDIDSWVMESINSFFKTTGFIKMKRIDYFFYRYASIAYDLKKEKRSKDFKSWVIMRSRPITPYEDARKLIENMVQNSSEYTNEIKAVMPILEKVYKLEGYKKMKDFLKEKNSLKK
ncbi:MAG: hypothetical protein GY714_07565 [Desulfobacterales bacterium]|nr:hypothetical protein [Desulfobacterales bacterium]MCP4161381.1 hypothetical protein [Deltaproteobacteria bacterium]